MKKKNQLFRLMLEFIRFGCFTFGGGWSIVAQLQRTYVREQKILTDRELMDLTSVAKSLPGVMIGNVAMLFGYRQAGIPGGVVCVLSISAPPFLILSVICLFYEAFRNNLWVSAALNGMQAAVVPIILSAALSMTRASVGNLPGLAVAALCFGLYLTGAVSPLGLVVLGGLAGLAMGEFYERRGGHGAS